VKNIILLVKQGRSLEWGGRGVTGVAALGGRIQEAAKWAAK